jgi:DNA-binding NarL/FixJ family response regulator
VTHAGPRHHYDCPGLAMPSMTVQELRVLALAAAGCPSKEIASRLDVCEATVKRHLTNTYRKLRVQNRAEATAVALVRGLIGSAAVLEAHVSQASTEPDQAAGA